MRRLRTLVGRVGLSNALRVQATLANADIYPPSESTALYPRACGGATSRPHSSSNCMGQPPRVRGNRVRAEFFERQGRFIPACAGEPRASAGLPAGRWVYPRVCGGTLDVDPLMTRRVGLSPRVRGNRMPAGVQFRVFRCIPACAGEPVIELARQAFDQVYPRVCGGTSDRSAIVLPKMGLSPRVRGNHAAVRAAQQRAGSIPACAGEPAAFGLRAARTRVYPRVCGGTCTGVQSAVATDCSPRMQVISSTERLGMYGLSKSYSS